MTFRTARSMTRLWGRVLLGLTLLGGALALTVLPGCGGSVSRVSTFKPTRFVSFGDELSLVVAGTSSSNGKKYSINLFATDTSGAATNDYNCTFAPLWNQVIAASFGFELPGCHPTSTATLAVSHAAVGATVAQVESQVAAFRATSSFDDKTLVTVMAGTHDIKAAYDSYVAAGRTPSALATARATLEALGTRMGQLVNGITNNGSGGRVIFAMPPDTGYSPFAAAEETASPGAQQVLKDLNAVFSDKFRETVTNDGRYAGLVAGYQILRDMYTLPLGYGLSNVTGPGCNISFTGVTNPSGITVVTLPDCNPNTMVTSTFDSGTSVTTPGSPGGYLWADELRPATAWHAQAGTVGLTRARNNPF